MGLMAVSQCVRAGGDSAEDSSFGVGPTGGSESRQPRALSATNFNRALRGRGYFKGAVLHICAVKYAVPNRKMCNWY